MLGSVKEGYGYVRVSTEQQVESGLSLDAQKRKIEAWFSLKDYKLLKIFADEGISGRSTEKRLGLKELLETVQRNQVVLICDLSRLSRSTEDAHRIYRELDERGASFVSLKENFDTSTPAGKLFFTMMAGINEFEANVISERIKTAMARMNTMGRANGKPPFGWKRRDERQGSGFVEVPEEQEILKLIFKKYDEGLNAYDIMKYLEEQDIPPPRKAKKWYIQTIDGYIRRAYDVNTGGKFDN